MSRVFIPGAGASKCYSESPSGLSPLLSREIIVVDDIFVIISEVSIESYRTHQIRIAGCT